VFQISRWDVMLDWLARESDSNRRELMLEWLTGWVYDPLHQAFRVPGIQAPVYLVVVPLPGVPPTIKFL